MKKYNKIKKNTCIVHLLLCDSIYYLSRAKWQVASAKCPDLWLQSSVDAANCILNSAFLPTTETFPDVIKSTQLLMQEILCICLSVYVSVSVSVAVSVTVSLSVFVFGFGFRYGCGNGLENKLVHISYTTNV